MSCAFPFSFQEKIVLREDKGLTVKKISDEFNLIYIFRRNGNKTNRPLIFELKRIKSKSGFVGQVISCTTRYLPFDSSLFISSAYHYLKRNKMETFCLNFTFLEHIRHNIFVYTYLFSRYLKYL